MIISHRLLFKEWQISFNWNNYAHLSVWRCIHANRYSRCVCMCESTICIANMHRLLFKVCDASLNWNNIYLIDLSLSLSIILSHHIYMHLAMMHFNVFHSKSKSISFCAYEAIISVLITIITVCSYLICTDLHFQEYSAEN